MIGGLTSAGVYLLLERNLTRMLLGGLLLIGNAVNLLILTVGGDAGNPPIRGRTSDGHTTTADPLAQGMILTAIVISMGIAAFVLALAYRSYQLTTAEDVETDPETARVAEAPRWMPTTSPMWCRPATPTRPTSSTPAGCGGGVPMTLSQVLTPLPVLIPHDRRGGDAVRRPHPRGYSSWWPWRR